MAEAMNYEQALASGAHEFRHTASPYGWMNRSVVTDDDLRKYPNAWKNEQFLPIPTAEELLSEVEANVIDISHFPHVECPVGIPLSEDYVKEGDRVRVRKVKG